MEELLSKTKYKEDEKCDGDKCWESQVKMEISREEYLSGEGCVWFWFALVCVDVTDRHSVLAGEGAALMSPKGR